MINTSHLDGVLEKVLILFLDVNWHRMEVMYLEALMRGGVLVLDFVMVIRFRCLRFVQVLAIVVNDAGQHAG